MDKKKNDKKTDYNVKRSPIDLLSLFMLFNERGKDDTPLKELYSGLSDKHSENELKRCWISKTIKVGMNQGCKTVANLVDRIEEAYLIEFS
jgi:hypothetical protein